MLVYTLNNGVRVQTGQDINGEVFGDYSGSSVSLSADGTVVAIGAYAMMVTVVIQVMFGFTTFLMVYGYKWVKTSMEKQNMIILEILFL